MAAAAADPRTLNIGEPQVLVHFPRVADGLTWRHRILLHRIADGRWVTLDPDHNLVIHDFGTVRHEVLSRASAFPAARSALVYAHDPVDAGTLKAFKRQAKLQAAIWGHEDPGEMAEFAWVVADPSDACFGETISDEAFEEAAALEERGVALHKDRERFVEKVARTDLEGWLGQRRVEGHDSRLLRLGPTSSKSILELTEAVNAMRPEPTQPRWKFDGPRACAEFLEQIRDGSGNFTSYHSEWIRLSGVNEGGAQAHEHRALCECLRLASCQDMLDLTNCAWAEHLVRRLISLEIAVERNPRHPNYAGLDIVEGGVISGRGSARVASFREHVSSRQKERANVLKQERLYREEQERFRQDPGKGKADGKSKGKRKTKGKPPEGAVDASGGDG